jgi:uncharacterized membrane protein
MKINKKELRRAEKRKMEQIRRKKKKQKQILTASIAVIAIMSVGIMMSMAGNPEGDIQDPEPSSPSDVISQTEVNIPLSEIGSDAKFYSYDSNGVDIRYFAVEGTDGDVHVAFDACDVCYDTKKGYRQQNDVMQCNNCGRSFSINSIGTDNTAGGCWPSYLPINKDDDSVRIDISNIETKRYMF